MTIDICEWTWRWHNCNLCHKKIIKDYWNARSESEGLVSYHKLTYEDDKYDLVLLYKYNLEVDAYQPPHEENHEEKHILTSTWRIVHFRETTIMKTKRTLVGFIIGLMVSKWSMYVSAGDCRKKKVWLALLFSKKPSK